MSENAATIPMNETSAAIIPMSETNETQIVATQDSYEEAFYSDPVYEQPETIDIDDNEPLAFGSQIAPTGNETSSSSYSSSSSYLPPPAETPRLKSPEKPKVPEPLTAPLPLESLKPNRVSLEVLKKQISQQPQASLQKTTATGKLQLPPVTQKATTVPKNTTREEQSKPKRKIEKEISESDTSSSESEPEETGPIFISAINLSINELKKAFRDKNWNGRDYVKSGGNFLSYTGIDDFDPRIFNEKFFKNPEIEKLQVLIFLLEMKYLFSSKKEGSEYPNLEAFLVCQIGIHRNSRFANGIIYRKDTELIRLVQELWNWELICSGKSLIDSAALTVKQTDAPSLVNSIFKTETGTTSSSQSLESARRVAKEERAILLANAFQSVAKEYIPKKTKKETTSTASDSSKEVEKKKLGRPKLTLEQKEENRKKRELEEREQKKKEEKDAKRKQKEQQEEEKESKRSKIVVEKTKKPAATLDTKRKEPVKDLSKKQKKTTFIPSEVACGDSDSN